MDYEQEITCINDAIEGYEEIINRLKQYSKILTIWWHKRFIEDIECSLTDIEGFTSIFDNKQKFQKLMEKMREEIYNNAWFFPTKPNSEPIEEPK